MSQSSTTQRTLKATKQMTHWIDNSPKLRPSSCIFVRRGTNALSYHAFPWRSSSKCSATIVRQIVTPTSVSARPRRGWRSRTSVNAGATPLYPVLPSGSKSSRQTTDGPRRCSNAPGTFPSTSPSTTVATHKNHANSGPPACCSPRSTARRAS